MSEETTTINPQTLKNQVTIWVDDILWKYVARVGIIISILGALGFLALWGNLSSQVKNLVEEKLPRPPDEIEKIVERAEKVSTDYQQLLEQFPVGSIIPVGLKTNETRLYEILPRNWVLCDGKKINENHPRQFKSEEVSTQFWNTTVPNLNDRFLRGTTNLDTVGEEVGTNTHSHQVSVSGGTGGPSELAHGKDKPNEEQFGNSRHTHNVTATGTASEVEYIPPSIKVFYIIKINH